MANGRFKLISDNKNYAGTVGRGIKMYKGIGFTDDEANAKRVAEALGYELVDTQADEKEDEDENADNEEEVDTEDNEEELYVCDECGKEYKTKSGLTRHMKDKH